MPLLALHAPAAIRNLVFGFFVQQHGWSLHLASAHLVA